MQPKDRQARTGRAAASRPDQVRRAEQNGNLSIVGGVNPINDCCVKDVLLFFNAYSKDAKNANK
jgi:hypothetical protein